MTLNDNPLVDAERRYKLLMGRREKLIAYSSLRLSVEYENGIAARMYINPYIKSGKAHKLIDRINKELRQLEKIIK